MENTKRFFAFSLAFVLMSVSAFSVAKAQNQTVNEPAAQQSTSALERGYRTGYSDGYPAGYSDSQRGVTRDYQGKDEYKSADRAYVATYGALEDYRDGYQQGFEAGYNAGYERRSFDSTIPAGLARRAVADARNNSADDSRNNNPASDDNINNSSAPVAKSGTIFIPADTVMRVELLTNLSTDTSQRGDRFQARVIEPREYEGAMLDGRVTSVKRAGKVKGTSELQLTFDQIRWTDNRFANIHAQVIEVVTNIETGASEVDPEGGVRGKDSTKDDVTKIGTGSAIGAVIGAIAGGGKGAAIGAVIGGGVATGGVLASRGKDIQLLRGQQLRIRTSTDTGIQ